MESQATEIDFGDVVHVTRTVPTPSVLVVCEHASNHVPAALNALGLDSETLQSHVAWDPGALAVAQSIAQRLPAVLVYGGVSRLVYDCNRPPEAPSAIPHHSEKYIIPGNTNLSDAARQMRVSQVFETFCQTLKEQTQLYAETLDLLVTIHSFTPVFNGTHREVELGILNGIDDRFAKAMMQHVPDQPQFVTRRNEPYAPSDGVSHTLDKHGLNNGLLNVMIEIRNDLIDTPAKQDAMATHLTAWITQTLDMVQIGGPQ